MGPRPVMVFDGDCGFCRYWVERFRALTGDRVVYRPFQDAAADFPAIPREAFEEAVQFVEPGGRVTSGADAVSRALEYTRGMPRLLGRAYLAVPGGRPLARFVYRWVARNRSRLGWTVPGQKSGKPGKSEGS